MGLTNRLPRTMLVGQSFSPVPEVRIKNENGFGVLQANLTAAVVNARLFTNGEAYGPLSRELDCSNREFSLAWIRESDLCNPELVGLTPNFTGDLGVAGFPELRFVGANPGLYTVGIKDENNTVAASFEVRVESSSTFISLTADSAWPKQATMRQPLPAIKVLVLDSEGEPSVNATVTAMTWTRAPDPLVDPWLPDVFEDKHATLTGNVVKTGKDGIAVFDKLTFEAANSVFQYLYFVCDGQVLGMKATSPMFLNSNVAHVDIVTGPGPNAVEAAPFKVQPVLKVTDAAGAPVAGVRVYAALTKSLGQVLPPFFVSAGVPQLPRKNLTYPITSAKTGADGTVKFSKLGFSAGGAPGNYSFSYVADGVWSTVKVSSPGTTAGARFGARQASKTVYPLANVNAGDSLPIPLEVLNPATGTGFAGATGTAFLVSTPDYYYNYQYDNVIPRPALYPPTSGTTDATGKVTLHTQFNPGVPGEFLVGSQIDGIYGPARAYIVANRAVIQEIRATTRRDLSKTQRDEKKKKRLEQILKVIFFVESPQQNLLLKTQKN